jgi:hypothetical protein
MMEKTALKIIALIDSIRHTDHDMEYLAWYMVYNSHRPMRERLVILAKAILKHDFDLKEEDR